jgi:hypothetical protein
MVPEFFANDALQAAVTDTCYFVYTFAVEVVSFGIVGAAADETAGCRLGDTADGGVGVMTKLVASATLYDRGVVACDYEFSSSSKEEHTFCLCPFDGLPTHIAEGKKDCGGFSKKFMRGHLPVGWHA